MNKLYRIWLFEDWELGQQQAWLSDMASEGWHVERLSPLVIFTKGTPSRMRYRCDVAETEDEEQIELYRAAGWEYVGRRRNVQIFRAPESANIPEIYTDTSEQAFTLRLLTRGLWQNTFSLVAVIIFFVFAFQISDGKVSMLLGTTWQHVLGALFVAHLLWMSVKGILHLTKIRSHLRRGRPLYDSNSHRGLRARRTLIIPAILVAAVIVLTGSVQARVARFQQKNFPPIPDIELAIPRLADVLKQAGYTEYYPSQTGLLLREQVGGDVFNYYRESVSLLVPVQQEIREKLDVPGVSWEDGATYSPILQVNRYEARSPGIARQLAVGLAGQKPDLFRLGNLDAASLEGVDGYWQRTIDDSHAFILLQGNTVVHVFYHGLEPFEQILALHLNYVSVSLAD